MAEAEPSHAATIVRRRRRGPHGIVELAGAGSAALLLHDVRQALVFDVVVGCAIFTADFTADLRHRHSPPTCAYVDLTACFADD